MNPFTLTEENGGFQVPCGKCYNCKRRRTSSWSVRLVKEGERSLSAHFLTLTYNTENVPISKNGFMTLEKSDLQKFFKRLRKWHGKKHISIKYYAVGEYGGQTKRPHYHIVIFNADLSHFERAWSIDLKPLGQIHIGTITEASIGYTLKYICKDSQIPMHKNDDRQKEFALMSKGLGDNYLFIEYSCIDQTIKRDKKGNWHLLPWITKRKLSHKKIVQWHKNKPEERIYVPLQDGKKAPLPRYYKQKIYDESGEGKISFHWKKKSDLLKDKEIAEHGDKLQSFKEEVYFNGNRKMSKIDNSQKL